MRRSAGEASPLSRIGLDDVAEQRQRRLGPADARIIAGQPAVRAVEGGGARIIGLEQARCRSDAGARASAWSPRASARLASSPWICARSHTVAAIRPPRIATSSASARLNGAGGLGVAALRGGRWCRAAAAPGRRGSAPCPPRSAPPAPRSRRRAGRFGAEPAGGRPVDDEVADRRRSRRSAASAGRARPAPAAARPWFIRCIAR